MPPKQAKLTDLLGKKKPREPVVVELDTEIVIPIKKLRDELASPAASGSVNLLSLVTDPTWKAAMTNVLQGPLGKEIESFLNAEISKKKEIFPPTDEIFAALNVTPLDRIKVVLIGQDPYHDNNQAHGLCFSVKKGIKPPPSLVNMYKELATDITNFKAPTHGYLMKWAAQEGILMLNASLTVEAHQANSHSKCGWQKLTDEIIKIINKECKDVVFLLWGGFAQKKGKIIDVNRHTALNFAHPSPLSAKLWFGCKSFSKCNEALVKLGKTPVDWHLPLE